MRADIEEILTAAPSVAAVMNARHELAKARDWKARPPGREEFIAAALEQPNLLRRPIVLRNGRVAVGTSLEAIRALFE